MRQPEVLAERAVTAGGKESSSYHESAEQGKRLRFNVTVAGEELTPSARLLEVALRFGVPMSIPTRQLARDLELGMSPGTITLITGPSGSGKSQLLAEIGRAFPASRLVHNVPFPLDVSVLDAISPTRPLQEAMTTLTSCGLGEPMLWIRRFHQLSDGEQFRARLSRAVSLHHRQGFSDPLLCDEFGAILHRRLAKALAFNLRKLVTRESLTLVVATSQHDLDQDLQPDCIVRMGGPEPMIEYPTRKNGQISFARQLRIERGTAADYKQFSAMHYRQTGAVGFVDKVFVLREGNGGPALGIVMYGHAPLELSLRNRVTQGRFSRNARKLNDELRILKRLVMHPDVRGCGLAHFLVNRTLPLVGKPFVECLAAMGTVNPVFDKAGMSRIGVCGPPPRREKLLAQLRATGAEPLSADFVSHIRRRPMVRKLVIQMILDWYRATYQNSGVSVTSRSPISLAQTCRQLIGSEPVYFLWTSDKAESKRIEQNMAAWQASKKT